MYRIHWLDNKGNTGFGTNVSFIFAAKCLEWAKNQEPFVEYWIVKIDYIYSK